ncbi:MAG TPA: arylsulfatase [Acidimicrobiales bacterium]|nr:arylsulfatase [Acidimicrobiales bacterium]
MEPPVPPRSTVVDAKDPAARFPAIEPLRPPAGAPNVLVVLLDDVGFGAPSTFGGPVATPTADRLAAGGLRYTRFHTTALCAPTRSALLTGRNHHAVGMGCVPDLATSAPGYSSVRPPSAAPLAEILRLNGYATAQFGKCHEVPMWETSPAGPFDRWPTGSGFEHFYGFVGGETNQWYPALFDGTSAVEAPATPEEGYHLTEDLADRAIAWVRQQKALVPDKPFFCYFAPGAAHAPHQVGPEWIARYRGRFDGGWDRLREETFARQQSLGVVPADARLTARPAEIPAWDEMDEGLRPVLARQMEVFAGFLEHADHHVGRLVDAIEDLGVLDDTLVFYILGDNGSSAEGTLQGTFNELFVFNQRLDLETPDDLRARIDEWGSPSSYAHFAVGWAHATCTPYQWTKQVASHWGGTRNGTVVHWPKGVAAAGELRHQFCHVIDVAPTVLAVAGVPEPGTVNGIEQTPMHGASLAATFADPGAPDPRDTQYFEVFCNRGIYHRGWTAVTRHSLPWVNTAMPAFADDRWELYDTTADWTQSEDLAARYPERLRELQDLFLEEAVRHGVLPLDDRRVERFVAAFAGRPELVSGRTQLLFGGMGRLSENSVINVKNVSHAVTALAGVPAGTPTGVLVAMGGAFGGWSLYLKDGHLAYCYNLLGHARTIVRSEAAVPAGDHQLRVEFAYDGGLGAGAGVTLYVDGQPAGAGRVEATTPLLFSADECTDVGHDTGTCVSDEYDAATCRWPGSLAWVRIDVGDDDQSHLLDPQQRISVAIARQ